jgi:hypothetical protein
MTISGISIPPPPDAAQLQYALGGINVLVGLWLLIRTVRGKPCPRKYLYFSAGSAIIAGALQLKAARDLSQPVAPPVAPQPQQTVTQAIVTAPPTAMPTVTPVGGR